MTNHSNDPAAAITVAKAAFPSLGDFGFGKPWEPINPAHVATAMAFLNRCRKTKKPTRGSYGLKHLAERWGRDNGLEPYITNGALIVAAVALGFKVIRQSSSDPNAVIGVHKCDL
jgi:hypothetical protein